MTSQRSTTLLSAVFVIGVLLFSFPLLGVASREATLFGLPVLYLYCFGAWAALIVVVALVVERADDGR